MKELLFKMVSFYELIKTFIYDHFIITVLFILGAIIIYLSDKFIVSFHEFLIKIKLIIKQYILNKHITTIMKRHEKEHDEINEIRKDIKKYIRLLKTESKRYKAMQFLLFYPSPEGLCAIMEIAVKEKDKAKRDEIICAIYKSAKNNKHWYC